MSSPSDPTADEILRGFLDERTEALEAVREWVAEIVRLRWRFADPESVVQEIVLELLRLARDGRVRRDTSFRAFVHTVARHTCVDVYRRERVRATVGVDTDWFESLDDPAPDPEQAWRRRERIEHVRLIYQQLDPSCRGLLRSFFGDGLRGPEIARELGITPGNVRVRIHRCLEKAREIGRRFLSEPAVDAPRGG